MKKNDKGKNNYGMKKEEGKMKLNGRQGTIYIKKGIFISQLDLNNFKCLINY